MRYDGGGVKHYRVPIDDIYGPEEQVDVLKDDSAAATLDVEDEMKRTGAITKMRMKRSGGGDDDEDEEEAEDKKELGTEDGEGGFLMQKTRKATIISP